MSLSTDNAFIAENTNSGDVHSQVAEGNPVHNTESAHGEGATPAPKDAINYYLKSLGDHRELKIFHYHVADLPVIFYDNQQGLHIYKSVESMEQEGLFTEVHHKIVHKDNPSQGVAFDASVTSLVCFQWIAMIVALLMFFLAGRRAKKNPDKAPHGIQNLLESVVVFVRDQVVAPNLPGKRVLKSLEHYFYALFFFILFMNLLGLLPGGHSATGAVGTTLALALTSFFVINITAMKEAGIGSWFKHLLGGAPWWLFFIMVPIEIISLFTKPFALTIRLFANMTAGHVVLLSLVGLIIYLQSFGMAPVSVGFSVFMLVLELLVAFLQAYIFTILTAVFTGLAIGDHAEHAH
jgi:F-type H+-transporting ATPase subunit a